MVFFLTWACFACTKDDGKTVVLLGKESYVKDIENVIPDSLFNPMTMYIGDLASGYVPPCIEGTYSFIPYDKHSSLNYGFADPDTIFFRFTSQHNRVVICDLNDYSNDDSIGIHTDTAYISGAGNHFTAYFRQTRPLTFGASVYGLERGVVMNGEVSNNRVSNLTFATVILDVSDNNDPYVNLDGFIGSWCVYNVKNDTIYDSNWYEGD